MLLTFGENLETSFQSRGPHKAEQLKVQKAESQVKSSLIMKHK